MKLVINNCYGGFHLSPKALKRYLELQGKPAYFYKQTSYEFQDGYTEFKRVDSLDDLKDELFTYCTTDNQGECLDDYPSNIFHIGDITRNDKKLVQVVEELGTEASVKFSNLVVREIENGRWYKIDEYDGWESIQYRDIDDEWMLAKDD